ncbi:MAG TPA: hypothetical protein PLR07_05560, partial [Promineifilum sp.]|nr:hypothetical protein [Promineifilum sp.]
MRMKSIRSMFLAIVLLAGLLLTACNAGQPTAVVTPFPTGTAKGKSTAMPEPATPTLEATEAPTDVPATEEPIADVTEAPEGTDTPRPSPTVRPSPTRRPTATPTSLPQANPTAALNITGS